MDDMDRFEQVLRRTPLRGPARSAGDELLRLAERQLRSQRRWRVAGTAAVAAACLLLVVNLVAGCIQARQIVELSSVPVQPQPLQTRLIFLEHIEARTRFIARNLSTGDSEAAELPEVRPTPAQRTAQTRRPASMPPVTVEQLRERNEHIRRLLNTQGDDTGVAPPDAGTRSNGALHQLRRCRLQQHSPESRRAVVGLVVANARRT